MMQPARAFNNQVNKRVERLVLVVIILLGTALRFYHLAKNSLWLDEIITQNLFKIPLSQMLKVVAQYDVHSPLFYLLARLNESVFGSSDFAARLPSVFFGSLMLPGIYALGRRLWGTSAGMLLGFIGAVWPAYLHYSQEARMYALIVALTIFALYALYRAWTTNEINVWLGYAIITIMAMYTHYFAMLFFAAQGAFVALVSIPTMVRSNRPLRLKTMKRLLMFGLVCILCAIAYIPWYQTFRVHQVRLASSSILYTTLPTIGSACLNVLRTILRFVTEGQPKLILALEVGVALGIVAGIVRRCWDALWFCLSCIVVPLLILGLTASPASLYPHRVFPFLTPLLLLVAGGLTLIHRLILAVAGHSGRSQLVGWSVLGVLLTAYLAPSTFAYYHTEKEDWRGVGQAIAAHKSPQNIVIADGVFYGIGGDAERVEQALPYYLGAGISIIKAEPGIAARLPTDESASGTVWGVIWYQGRLADRDALADTIEIEDFYNLALLRLRQPSGTISKDSVGVLEAMLSLQPLVETHPDLHLALAQLCMQSGNHEQAGRHLSAAAKAMPKGDQRLAQALADLQHEWETQR